MADNFRNKQWFKKLSQEHKDELCKKFDIDEKTLKKAGRESEDGRIVIDLLRIDHLCTTPPEWNTAYNAIKDNEDILKSINDAHSVDNKLENIKTLYNLYKNVSYLKYKNNLHNDCLINYGYKNILSDIEDYLKSKNNADKEYIAYKLYLHLNIILNSDLELIKK